MSESEEGDDERAGRKEEERVSGETNGDGCGRQIC